MDLAPYRRILRRDDVRNLLLLTFLARIPIAAAPLLLTLHVVLELERGFASSGMLAAAFAMGAAIGAPMLGRAIDRLDLRPVLVLTTIVDGAFWLLAVQLAYWPLVGAAFFAGLLAIPVFSVSRQSLAAMLPAAQRQAGFSLDSMSVELSFAVGPAAGIVLLTRSGSAVTLVTVGVLIVLAGVALIVVDPPVHGRDEDAPPEDADAAPARGQRPPAIPIRRLITAPVGAVLLMTFATTFTVVGTDTAITAVMRSFDQVGLIGLVFAIWCLASLVGGFVYGAAGRVEPMLLLVLLAALCIPAALASNWWLLAVLVIPTGLFCAPMISATAQELVRLTPVSARGQVMGIHGSALTVGNALGAPAVGLVVDHGEPRLGFVAIGLMGLLVAGGISVVLRRTGPAPETMPAPRSMLAGKQVNLE